MDVVKGKAVNTASHGAAKILFTAGTVLMLGTAVVTIDKVAAENSLTMERFTAAPEKSVPAPTVPLISYMPPAYDAYERTDYVSAKAAREALDRLSVSMRIPKVAPVAANQTVRDASLAYYSGPNARYVIMIERDTAGKWGPPEGPVTVIAGKIFADHAPDIRNVVNVSLKRPDGLVITVRGRGSLRDIGAAVKKLGVWDT